MIAGIPNSEIVLTSFTTSDSGSLSIAGIELICFFASIPSSTKTGQIKSFGEIEIS